MVTVISLGGSIVAPGDVDSGFVSSFIRAIRVHLGAHPGARCVLVVGGGAPARVYQRAYSSIRSELAGDTVPGAASGDECGADSTRMDWIGIMATRLNAELVKAAFGDLCSDPVVIDPSGDVAFTGRVLVGAGWKPGFSTDFDAVLLAERFGADTVVNLSNIEQVCTADPRIDPSAQPLERVSWAEFKKIVGEDWKPGSNLPFDPVATRKACELGMKVIVAGGRNIGNLERILAGGDYFGTTIGV